MEQKPQSKTTMEWASLKKEATIFPMYSMRKAWDVLEKEIYGVIAAGGLDHDMIMRGKLRIGSLSVLDPRLGNLIHSLQYTRLSIESIQSPPTSMILEYIQACERVYRIIDRYRKLAG